MSWGKIKLDATPVKVSSDATIVFPLIVSQTFFKEVQRRQLEIAGGASAVAAVTTTIATGVKVETDSDITLKTKKSRIDDFTGVSLDATLPVRGEAKV